MVSALNQVDVMIVDDEAFMRKTLFQMLRKLGVAMVREASNGNQALQELISLPVDHRPNLLICDINMDGLDGLELLDRLRRHQDLDLASLPVIVATAHSDVETVWKAVNRQVAGYLVKPFTVRQLRSRIDQSLADLPPRTSITP